MSWQDAPVLNKLAAAQLTNKNGAQIWGVDFKGKLHTSYQTTPGGEWSKWFGPDWAGAGYPKEVYELCASQELSGGAQLWVLDGKRQLWTIQQDNQGKWSKWQNDWNRPPGSFKFKKMAAALLGNGTARFWGITEDGILTSCLQSVPLGNWGAWSDWPKTPHDLKANPPVLPAEWIEVTACTQGDGRGALWALDTKMQLWGMGQESPGGKWGPWSGPKWMGAQKFLNIAAVEETVDRRGEKIHGACIFGITDDYQILFNEQAKPGADYWFGWAVASFKAKLKGFEITAAQQNNQSARVWVIGNDNDHTLVSQQVRTDSSPPGWERFWTPDVEDDASE